MTETASSSSADGECLLNHCAHEPQGRFVAGVNGENRLVNLDMLAYLFDTGQSDGEVDFVAGSLATGTEQERSTADQVSVHFLHPTGGLCAQRLDHRRAGGFDQIFQRSSGTV